MNHIQDYFFLQPSYKTPQKINLVGLLKEKQICNHDNQ